jgi:hypothetical protein
MVPDTAATEDQRELQNDVLLIFIPYYITVEWLNRVRTINPHLEIRWVNSMNPDRSVAHAENLPAELWDGVTMLCTYRPPPAELTSKVRFVQLTSAGSDLWAEKELYKNSQVVFCNSSGIHP